MSSATSTDSSTRPGKDSVRASSAAIEPWQFFLLAGMVAATALVVLATGQSPAAIILLSVTVIASSLVGLGVYRALAPLVSREPVQGPTLVAGRTRAALEREKTLVLRSIKELEFDYAMKKVARADFDEMAGRLRGRALRLMRQLEAGDGYRAEIERELNARLGARLAAQPTAEDVAAADGVFEADGAAKAAPHHACASCGTTNDPDARFCKSCGSRIAATV